MDIPVYQAPQDHPATLLTCCSNWLYQQEATVTKDQHLTPFSFCKHKWDQ